MYTKSNTGGLIFQTNCSTASITNLSHSSILFLQVGKGILCHSAKKNLKKKEDYSCLMLHARRCLFLCVKTDLGYMLTTGY